MNQKALCTKEKASASWNIETHAFFSVQEGKMRVDELRTGIEGLDKDRYLGWSYYDKWSASIATAALARGLLTEDERNTALGRALARTRLQGQLHEAAATSFFAHAKYHHKDEDGHHHDQDHHHDPRYDTEKNAFQKQSIEMLGERLGTALLFALHAKGHLDIELFRHVVEAVEKLATPMKADLIAPRLVARAWKDPDFLRRLLTDATLALQKDFNFKTTNSIGPAKLSAVANTPQCHNFVVCTLCSCYPLSILDLAFSWYKDVVYRARAVEQPRKLLHDAFNLQLDDKI